MQKILVKAMECDLTSAATIRYMPVVSPEARFRVAEMGDAPHTCAHWNGEVAERHDLLKAGHRLYVRTWTELFSDLLAEIKSKPGLIEKSVLLFQSDMSDGNAHNDSNIPTVVAGAGSDLKLGQELGSATTPRVQADLLREIGSLTGVASSVTWGAGKRASRGESTGIIA